MLRTPFSSQAHFPFWNVSAARRHVPRHVAIATQFLEDRTLLSVSNPLGDVPAELAVDQSSYDSQSLLVRYSSFTECTARGCDTHSGLSSLASSESEYGLLPGLRHVRLSRGVSVEEALAAFRADPHVLYAEPNYRVHLQGTPDDVQFDSLWGLNNTGQTGGLIDADIDAAEAWDLSTGSGNTVVAVIDTGVDYTHPDLAGNMWVNAAEANGQPNQDDDGNGFVDDVYGYDFANNDADPKDDHDHGTHVAGTIGAVGNNALGVTGVNWDVQIMALKFLGADGSGTLADAIRAIDYSVANGAVISNNSWGDNEDFSQALFDAIDRARAAGQIFVAAAGNGNIFGIGLNNDTTPFYPSNYELDNVVAVAATDHFDQLAGFSNFGATTVDLAAPGVGILSTTRSGTYSSFSGTSMAAPHVAGTLALVRDLHPEWTHQEVIARVLENVDPIPALAGRTVTGGRLNAYAALAQDLFGPMVIEQTPEGLTDEDVSNLRVTFSERIDPATFTLGDIVSFTGPSGGITASGLSVVPGTNNRQFDITFPNQSEIGYYTLVIGPDIRDTSGDPMDQDRDQVPGENPDDTFAATFRIVPFLGRYDFGTASSPVQTAYTRVDPQTVYSAPIGFGWQGAVLEADRFSGTPLSRDFNFNREMTFLADVPVGTYDVTLTIGDAAQFQHDHVGIFLEGSQVDTVTTNGGEIRTFSYQTTVEDGQFTLEMRDLGGADVYAVLNGLQLAWDGPDLAGPRITTSTPLGFVTGTTDRITVEFNESITDGTFTLDDVTMIGPAGPINPSAVVRLNSTTYEVRFPDQADIGAYTLSVGPEIEDLAGNRMDQDQDGINGEPVEDAFLASFTIVPFLGRYDFGTTGSPVAAGYVQVDPGSGYQSAVGHGWLGGAAAVDRGTGTALTQDLSFGQQLTFLVDVPGGTYDVTISLGDTAGFAHDVMGVFLEGSQVDTVTTAPFEVQTLTYSTTVHDGQLTLQLQDLGGSDANVVINGLQVAWTAAETVGPHVVSTIPSDFATSSIDRIVVDFNEAIAAETFTLSDVVSLNGPLGPITPTAVNALSASSFEVTFPAQTEAGLYSLAIGPEIEDLAGNAMDQDQDGTNGEAVEDRFSSSITLVPFLGRYDFGTAASPVESGYTQVTAGTAYQSALGFGWQTGVLEADRGAGTSLTRDFNFNRQAVFLVDVPAGTYDVTVTMGDTAGFAHDLMGVILEGTLVDTVSTAAFEVKTVTHSATVSDGQLMLEIQDLGGSDVYAVINSVEIAWAGSETVGPYVISSSPTDYVTSSIDRMTVEFNEAIAAGTMTLADVVSLTGPLGPITATAVNQLSPTSFEVVFPIQSEFGLYALTIGPDIEDIAGNLMDQDQDGINGEASEDQFTSSVTRVPFLGRYDFGTSNSPVEPGYTQVTPATTYQGALGYGWQTGVLQADRGTANSLTRDFNFNRHIQFVADVPAGTYDVTVTMGDTAGFGHDLMGVSLEGTLVDTVSTAPFEVRTSTYSTTVSDGQLTLDIQDLGGSDVYVVINSLELAWTGSETIGPRVISTSPTGYVTGSIDRIAVEFNEEIAAGTFTVSDVTSLNGPTGPLTPTSVNSLSATSFEVVFPAQADFGAYSLTIGPLIEDLAGNVMDQDQDGVNGEAVADAFSTTVTLTPFLERYDFGTATSPVEPGHIRVDGGTAYHVSRGYGWQGGALAVDRGTSDPLTRDLNFNTSLSFAVDVPSGAYDIVLTLGDAAGYAHDLMAVFLEGTQVATLTTAGYEVVTVSYSTTVDDGQLTLEIVDQGGSDANAVINGLQVAWTAPETVGPRVTAVTPVNITSGSIDRFSLEFNEALADGTFSLADVVSLSGPNGPLTATAVNKLSDDEYEVLFAAQTDTGDYSLTIGPDISDQAGNLMDQDGDGVNGETVDDRFTTTVSLIPFVGRYDFGTAASPVETGYTSVDPSTSYLASRGYGWLSGVAGLDRGAGGALDRDLNFAGTITFAVDVPNGTYDLTLTLGDTGGYVHDLMAVEVEDQHIDTVTTNAFEVQTLSYTVTVSDGQLTLRLQDLGGIDSNVVINGLEVIWTGSTASSAMLASIRATHVSDRDDLEEEFLTDRREDHPSLWRHPVNRTTNQIAFGRRDHLRADDLLFTTLMFDDLLN